MDRNKLFEKKYLIWFQGTFYVSTARWSMDFVQHIEPMSIMVDRLSYRRGVHLNLARQTHGKRLKAYPVVSGERNPFID